MLMYHRYHPQVHNPHLKYHWGDHDPLGPAKLVNLNCHQFFTHNDTLILILRSNCLLWLSFNSDIILKMRKFFLIDLSFLKNKLNINVILEQGTNIVQKKNKNKNKKKPENHQ